MTFDRQWAPSRDSNLVKPCFSGVSCHLSGFGLIGNYLTTDQVLAVGGIQFQSEPLRKRNHLVELRMLHHATVTMSR